MAGVSTHELWRDLADKNEKEFKEPVQCCLWDKTASVESPVTNLSRSNTRPLLQGMQRALKDSCLLSEQGER